MARTVVAIGEALWDVFPDRRRPGGAPCNVAFHAARLGDHAAIVTRVGADALGDELVAFLRDRTLDVDYVQRDPARPTGTVMVSLENAEPRYTITEAVAWDHLTAAADALALMRAASAVCVGSLAQRTAVGRAAVQRLLDEARDRALVVFDVNLRPPFIDAQAITATLRAADVVKMNESEAARLAALLERPALERWLLEDGGVRYVCVTRGHGGASIATPHETVSVPGMAIDRSAGDAVGAGDAFTAAMIHRLVRGAPLRAVLDAANRYAALVATKAGAMPDISPGELALIGF